MAVRNQRKVKHTHVAPKTRVRVTLHDDTVFTDHFVDTAGGNHIFKERGKIRSKLIYQLTIMPKSYEIQQQIREMEKKR